MSVKSLQGRRTENTLLVLRYTMCERLSLIWSHLTRKLLLVVFFSMQFVVYITVLPFVWFSDCLSKD